MVKSMSSGDRLAIAQPVTDGLVTLATSVSSSVKLGSYRTFVIELLRIT